METDTLLKIFSKLQGRLGLAMHATGCREQWLQAEIMMEAAKQKCEVWTNTEPLYDADGIKSGNRKKYDLSSYSRDAEGNFVTEMVAEIKIIGGDFNQKCLWGTNLEAASKFKAFYPEGGSKSWKVKSDQILPPVKGDWGLFADAARLLCHPAKKRWLILVILTDRDLKEGKHQDFLRALQTLSIVSGKRPEIRHSFKTFDLRIWPL